MSRSKRIDILRLIRLQLKSGYLTAPPPVMEILKTVPPLDYKRSDMFVKSKVPYAHLLKKVYARTPFVEDETVYPAYGHLDTKALILAKKQYFYVQQGLSEEEAYKKACQYMEELEDQALGDMKEITNAIQSMGASAPFLSDPAIATEISKWQGILRNVDYDELSAADQGNLDRFIQTKILKWSELERERRMKDIVFFMQFESLLKTLFPTEADAMSTKRKKDEFQLAFSKKFLDLYGYQLDELTTNSPFLVEDYFRHFEKMRANPNVADWSDEDWYALQDWVEDTLAFTTALHAEEDSYFEDLFDQFFPIMMLPLRAEKLKLPETDELRRLLYENQIGYKKVDDKLFVKRFYKIPQLLFPTDVFCAKLARNPLLYHKTVVSDSLLLEEMTKFGLPESKLGDVKQILKENRKYILKRFEEMAQAIEAKKIHSAFSDETSAVEDILDGEDDDDEDGDDEDDETVSDTADGLAMREAIQTFTPVVDINSIDDRDLEPEVANLLKDILNNPTLLARLSEQSEITDEILEELLAEAEQGEEEEDVPEVVADADKLPETNSRFEREIKEVFFPSEQGTTKASADWDAAVKKYIPEPITQLQKARNEFLAQSDLVGQRRSDLSTESELKAFAETREETERLIRARLSILYEKKEIARRESSASERQLLIDELPALEAPITTRK